jgi:glycosyltransferase involved in cell wall biosynthesis
MDKTTTPSVIVLMPTYNHEKYIGQAIESVLNQITSFGVHLYVSDDSSDDSTFSIASTFSNRNNVFIRLNRMERNIGAAMNGAWLRNKALESDCRYVAILEGDDYWTDPLKLQKQVDFLEANPDFVLCYHSVEVLFPDGNVITDYLVKDNIIKRESNIYDLALFGNYIHTPSAVFKNIIKKFPPQFNESPIGDLFLWILVAEHGLVKKIEGVMAVYRIGVGMFSVKSNQQRNADFLKMLELLSEVVSDKAVIGIIKQRLMLAKLETLPKRLKSKNYDSFSDINKASQLVEYVSLIELVKALWLKIAQKILFVSK